MYRTLIRNYNYISLCGVALVPNVKDFTFDKSDQKLVGWPAVKRIFYVDEFGDITPQLHNILNSTFMTGLFGAVYGGYLESKDAYFKFIETSQATKFTDHFDAKKKLQNAVSLGFAKGALKWSMKIAFFGGLYVSIVTMLNAYKGDIGILDFTLAGILSGGIYRLNMGLKGFIGGSTLGAFIGTFAGSFTVLLNNFFGISFDDVEKNNYDLVATRQKQVDDVVRKHKDNSSQVPGKLLQSHEENILQSQEIIKN